MRVASAAELAADLERRIVAGQLAAGERLDPVRVAAASLDLAPNTVASAYRVLAERGLVIARGRAGTFVDERTPSPRHLEPLVPEGVVDLASGRPDPALLPDLGPVLADLEGSHATYGDPALDPALASAARRILSAEGVSSDHLAVTGGAMDGVERALAAYLRPGAAVAVEDPGWFAVADLIRAMGAVPLPVATDDEGLIPSALAAVIRRVAAVLVTPRAQNPTGSVLSPQRAQAVADVVETAPEVLVVEDDHMGTVGGGALNSVASGGGRWVHVRSFSKSLGPDLRVAIVAGDQTTIGRLAERQLLGPGWVSHILQRAVASLLEAPATQHLMRTATEVYADRRRLMVEALARRGVMVGCASGINVWVPVENEEVATYSALEAGYAVRGGSPFRHRAAPAIRVTIARIEPSQAEEVAEALSRPRTGVAKRLV